MDKLTLMGIVAPLITAALSVPLIFEMVPPNGIYGFRTPKTLASPEVWYNANRAAGIYMLLASVASLVVCKLMKDRATVLDAETLAFRMGMVFTFAILAALAAAFVKLRNL